MITITIFERKGLTGKRDERYAFNCIFVMMKTRDCAGGIAQLGEHLAGSQGVKGSNPFTSTRKQPGNGESVVPFFYSTPLTNRNPIGYIKFHKELDGE